MLLSQMNMIMQLQCLSVDKEQSKVVLLITYTMHYVFYV